MEYKISYIPGDGIGPEIMEETLRVLDAIAEKFGHVFEFRECIAGTKAVDSCGEPLPDESLKQCRESQAVLLGNMWMSLYPELPEAKRPARLLGLLRKELKLSINIRPIYSFGRLKKYSPLKEDSLKDGFDILLIRDLMGGVMASDSYRKMTEDGEEACDYEFYKDQWIRQIVSFSAEAARNRKKKVVSLDKAVVLESSRLWRKVVQSLAGEYKDVTFENQHIDDAAGQIIQKPENYDVIVTTGMFGDILADEISALTGIQKILPSAELNANGQGLYTPNQLHNRERESIGQNTANPIGLIWSAALMLRYSLNLPKEAEVLEKAIKNVLNAGYATKDFYKEDSVLVGTEEIATRIIEELEEVLQNE